MTMHDPEDPRPTPREEAEQEEQELTARVAAERGVRGDDDPREEEGWSQPESSAQKGALPDES